MKKNLVLVGAAILGLLLTACNKDEGGDSSTNGLKDVTISISGVSASTKSAIEGTTTVGDSVWIASPSISKVITHYDVYFTKSSGTIAYAYRLSSSSESSAYTAFQEGKAVRFIGLTDVTDVYVVANSPSTMLQTGSAISNLVITLNNYQSALNEQSKIMYVGGGAADENLQNEDATNVGADITTGTSQKAGQYYSAAVTIRPMVSRLEIGSICVENSGTYEGTADVDGTTYYYTVSWTGYTPTLTGIYMSNFCWGNLYPVSRASENWFQTPSGDYISSTTGLWSGTTFDDSACNADGISLYTNGNDTKLFNTESGQSGNNYYYFNGGTSYCVPFNFLVPFDVMATTATTDQYGLVHEPNFHFRFVFDSEAQASGTAYSLTKVAYKGTSESETYDVDITNNTSSDLYLALTSKFNFTSVSDGVYYANIVDFYENASKVTIAPHTIYKIDEVKIAPYNFTTSALDTDEYNIVVNVTVAPYSVKTVTPAFGSN